MTENHSYFETIVSQVEDAVLGNMFGKPCGKINKKAFVAFFEDEMVFKLGKENLREVFDQYNGAKNWDPSGKKRPMKDWVQIPQEYKSDWPDLMIKALEFVKS